MAKYPYRIHGGYCTADRISGMVISSNGAIFKCWNFITADEKEAVGHLMGKGKNHYQFNFQKWMAHNVFENPECRNCKILPICMGGCPYENMKLKSGETLCSSMKFNLINLLRNYYISTKKFKKKKSKSKKQRN